MCHICMTIFNNESVPTSYKQRVNNYNILGQYSICVNLIERTAET
jgi:hypothetical protein